MEELVSVTDLGEVDDATPQVPAATADKRARIRELAEWDQLDRTQRRALGLPLTDTEWARVRGLHVRRVAKYRDDPYYKTCADDLRDLTRKRIAPGGAANLADIPFSATAAGLDDSADYAAIKSQLAALARQGEQKALEIWLKNWGKPFLDEEVAGRVADLSAFSDEELVTQVVELVNPNLLAGVLIAAGWTVEPPCRDGLGANGATHG